MSNVFGVPPPPQPNVFEPGWTSAPVPPNPEPATEWVEPDRRSRRWALVAAFLAVCMLALTNLAVWLQFTALRPAQASQVATATFDPVAERVTKPVYDYTRATVRTRGESSLITPTRVGADDRAADDDVRQAVDLAVRAAATRAAWEQAVATALSTGRESLDEGDGESTARLPLQPISEDAVARLKSQGYGFPSSVGTTLGALNVPIVDGSRDLTASGGLGGLWWLFLIGTVALGWLSIWLASRRLRLAVVLAIDTAVVFAVFLGFVLLTRQLADDGATDPVQATVLRETYSVITQGLVVQTVVIVVVVACAAIGLGVLVRSRERVEALRRAARTAA